MLNIYKCNKRGSKIVDVCSTKQIEQIVEEVSVQVAQCLVFHLNSYLVKLSNGLKTSKEHKVH